MTPVGRVTNTKQLEAAFDALPLTENLKGFIFTQMACTMCGKTVPGGFYSSLGLDANYPLDKAWGCFGLVEKIAIFIRSWGFHKCALQVPLWPETATASPDQDKWIEGLQAYQKRIQAATRGHLTAFMLSHFDVLQMLIFSTLYKIIEKGAHPDARAADTGGDRVQAITPEQAFEKVHEYLFQCFFNINKIIAHHRLDDLASIPKEWLQSVISVIDSYKKTIEQIKGNPIVQLKVKELAYLKEMIDLIREACDSPVDLLPILVSPLLSQQYDFGSMRTQDQIHLAPEALDWLEDFRRVCKFQTDDYFKSLLKNAPRQKKAVEVTRRQFKDLWDQAEEVNKTFQEKVTRLLQFQVQPVCEQLQNHRTLDELNDCVGTLHAAFAKVGEIHAKLQKDLPLHPDRWTVDSLISYPFNHYSHLMAAVLFMFTTKRQGLINVYNALFNTLIPTSYLLLNSLLITPIDLIDFKFRSLYVSLEVHHKETLRIGTCALALMRTLFSPSKTTLDYEEKSICIHGAHSLLLTSARLLKADEKFGPLIKLLRDLSELLRHDSWPALVSTPPAQSTKPTPVEERRFFYDYYLSIRKMFLIYDVGNFLDLIPDALEQEKSAILKLFEEVQSKIQTDTPPALENYEAPALQFCEQIGDFVGAVQERLVKILEILETENPQAVEEFTLKMETAHQYLEALLISPLQNLGPFLIGWELMETEKKQARTAVKPLPAVVRRARPKAVQTASPVIPKETLKPQSLEEPKTLEGYHAGLHTLLKRLTQDHLGFISPDPHAPKKEKALLNIQHTLHHLQPLMLSLPLYGHLPGVVWEVHSRFGVLVEQTVKTAAYVKEIPIPEELFYQHHPEQILDHLKEVQLSTEERAVIHKGADLMIASRYPAMRRDELTKNLTALLKIQNPLPIVQSRFQSDTQKALLAHMKICFKILNALPYSGQGEIRHQDSLVPLQKVFRAPVATPAFPKLLSQLKRMRFHIHQPLDTVSPRETSLWKRKSTLYTSHRELMMMIQLARDLLTTPRDPALVLYMCSEALKIEACIFEHALLMILAKLSCPSNNPSSHFLYEKPINPLRYSHRLDLFAEEIRHHVPNCDPGLIAETLKRATYLTPYLKQLYRYLPEEETGALSTSLAQLRTLSYLWENQEDLSQAELKFLDAELGSQPLAAYIQDLMEKEYLASLSRTLELASKWLFIFTTLETPGKVEKA